tara:strand:- start:9 stop:389 length:381 start_codon:yes stop_codon:yes gene_type:complete
MFYQLNVSTKSLNTLKCFLDFLETIQKKPYSTKFKLLESSKKKKNRYYTILKSPHVNKTAREQIGFNVYNKIIYVHTTKIDFFSMILKKIKSNLFFDLSIKIILLKRIHIYIYIFFLFVFIIDQTK